MAFAVPILREGFGSSVVKPLFLGLRIIWNFLKFFDISGHFLTFIDLLYNFLRFCTFLQYLRCITLGIILPQSIVRMLFKRSETIVYGSTHTTTASLNGSIWISIETVSSRRAARWRHSRITIQFSVVWSRTFGPGSIFGPFVTYEKHRHNQNKDNLKKRRFSKCEKSSNFSCTFLNPNNFFQFEF